MNLHNEKPTLKNILEKIKNNEDFKSRYVLDKEKLYFLSNLESIDIFNGKYNQIAFIKKK